MAKSRVDVLKPSHRNVMQDQQEEEIKKMMTAPKTNSDAYWRQLAEDRAAAIEETIKENKTLLKMISALRRENEALAIIAEQKEHLERLAKQVLVLDSTDENTET